MRKETSISVSLVINEKVIDLQIPIQVTVNRLKKLIKEALTNLGISVPATFKLVVSNKPILLEDIYRLSDYPVGNGDQFMIQEILEEKSI